MPRKCAAYMCRRYNGEPYSQMIKLPCRVKEEEEWKEWITAMPNPPKTLENRRELYICQKHFHPNCEWKKIRGGKRPDEPPCIFENVPNSCLKPRKLRRSTTSTSSDTRHQKEIDREIEQDKIKDFNDLSDHVLSRVSEKIDVIKNENNISLFMTDDTGSKVRFSTITLRREKWNACAKEQFPFTKK